MHKIRIFVPIPRFLSRLTNKNYNSRKLLLLMGELASVSKIDEYVRKFGGATHFFKKILDSLEFPFSIINTSNFETEISNMKGFSSAMKCYKLYYSRNEKCEKCPIDQVIKKRDKVCVEDDEAETFLIPIFGREGQVVSIINYKIKKKKIIEEKIVEKRSKEYEESFYNILQNSQDIVYRYNFASSNFEYVSESVFTIMGFPLSEFVNMRYDDFLSRIHPEDIEEASKFEKNVGEVAWEGEYRWKCKDGKYKWFLDKRVWLFDKNGMRLCVVGSIKDISAEKEKEEDKRLLEERLNLIKEQKENNERVSLTDREKIVIWGLCRWSLLNDEELSEKLKLKRSTLTAIKNRLKKKGWFSLKYIPNFAKLGCQFTGVFDGNANACKLNVDFLKKVPEIILNNYQNEKFFGVFVSDKYVIFKKFLENFEENNPEVLKLNESSFFYDMENFELKDFSEIINSLFGLKRKEKAIVYDFKNADNSEKNDLNINERRVLHAMVKYPDISSTEIAKKVWISKPTVIKIRNKLIEQGFVYAMIIPSLKKLGFEYFAKFNYEFDSDSSLETGKREEIPKTILKINGKKRIVKFVLFANEEEYMQEVNLIKNMHRNNIFFRLNSDIFPIQKRGKSNFDIEPFLNELLFKDEL